MFTGIIEEVGEVRALHGGQLVVAAATVLEGTRLGDSVAINGACLTVTDLSPETFTVALMPETLRRTSLGALRTGDPANLERALILSQRLGGHLLQGHVEGTGTLRSLTPEGDAVLASYEAPPDIMRYVVSKGFIAVDGVSLTVVGHDERCFTVSLVEYTQQHTNLTQKKPGAVVNLETDIVARYVERFLGERV